MKKAKTTPCTEYAFNNAPRCGAKARTNNYLPCRNPAMQGKKRCRMHGGAKGSGAKKGNSNAYKHGYSTEQTKNLKSFIRKLLKTSKFICNKYNKV